MMLTCIPLGLLSRRMMVDLSTNTFKVSYVGRVFKVHQLNDFVKFESVEHYMNGMYTGTELLIHFRDGTYPLGQTKKTNRLKELLDETKFIMSLPTKSKQAQ